MKAGSTLIAGSPTRGWNSQALRSWPEPKSAAQLTEPPRAPLCGVFERSLSSVVKGGSIGRTTGSHLQTGDSPGDGYVISVRIAKGIAARWLYLVLKITQYLVQTGVACAVRGAWPGHLWSREDLRQITDSVSAREVNRIEIRPGSVVDGWGEISWVAGFIWFLAGLGLTGFVLPRQGDSTR